MEFITITLKENIMLSCCLQTQFSLVYEIETEDVNENFYEKFLFYFSNIHNIQNFLILSIKNLLANEKFKGKIISEFVGLKSKMYSLVNVDGEEIKKAKEVNKSVVKTQDIKIN